MASNTFKGFVYGAVAAASYGLNPLFTLPLYADGVSADSVLFYRYGLGVVMLALLMKVQKQSFALHRSEVLPLLVMGMLFAFSSLTLFQSYNYMDAGIASTILFVYPVLVAVIMAVFFKEKVSVITAVSIALAFVGISLLYKGEDFKLNRSFTCLYILTYVCYLYYRSESFVAERHAYCKTYILCFIVWLERICCPFEVLYASRSYQYSLAVDQSDRVSFVPDCNIFSRHD